MYINNFIYFIKSIWIYCLELVDCLVAIYYTSCDFDFINSIRNLECGALMHDKIMKLALALCETFTEDEIIELSGYLQSYADARVREKGISDKLVEELI